MTRHRTRVYAAIVVAGTLVLGAFAGSASGQVQDWPSSKPPAPAPTRPAPFPAAVARTLPNGLRVVVVQQREQPVVCLQLMVRAGSAFDPAGKGGLSSLTASLLARGTETRSAAAIAETIDGAGAELTTSSGPDAAFVQITLLKDAFETGLGLLADLAGEPVFAAGDLERQRAKVRSALVRSYADASYLAKVVFDRFVFDGHPYGMPPDGTPDSIGGITRDDVVAFHNRFYAPNNSVLAVVGDVDVDAALAGVARAFGAWPTRAVPVIAGTATDFAEPRQRVVVIDTPEATVAQIRVGQRAPTRRDDAWVAMDLATRVLGGEGITRLYTTLGQRRVLTIGASAQYDTYLRTGVLRASTLTVPLGAGEGAKLMAEEFARLRNKRVGDDELAAVRTLLRGSYPMALETPGAISTRILNAMLHEVPFRLLETYVTAADALTPEDLQAAIQPHLVPDRLVTVVVGPAPPVLSALRTAGFRDIEVFPIDQLDLAAPTLRRPAAGPAAVNPAAAIAAGRIASREEWDRAREVIVRAAAAAGGLDALRQITTLSATARTTLYLPTGPVRAETKTLIQYPDRLRVDAVTPRGLVVQAFDAGHAWIWEERGQRDAPPAMQREFDAALRRDWIRLFIDTLDARVTGRRLADETGAGGRTLHVVEVWSEQLAPCRVAIDAATGRLERVSYQTAGPFGAEQISETYSDFRQVAGVHLPFRAVVRRDDAPVLDRAVLELKVNPVLQPGAFAKPK